MSAKKEALAQELNDLAQDLKTLLHTLTSDPKEQARKERRWRILYTALSAVAALGARRVATHAWGILTGEQPPGKGEEAAAGPRTRESRDREPAATH
jgi:hypothetical protein